MITQELINFIQQNISQGKTKDEIKSMLLSSGDWQESDIEEAFNSAGNSGYKKKSFKWIVLFLLIVGLVVVGYYFITKKEVKDVEPVWSPVCSPLSEDQCKESSVCQEVYKFKPCPVEHQATCMPGISFDYCEELEEIIEIPASEVETSEEDGNSNPASQSSVLDIPLTQAGIENALPTWNTVETVERGGRFMVPHDWIVTKINEDGQVLWKIDTPAGISLDSFATAANREFSIQKYGEPNSCYGGDAANALCVYGDNPELLHYGQIMGWY